MHFWQTKTLDELSHAEWESLCDGCGQCCLHKIEDVDSQKYYCTNIACKLLDLQTARCKDYKNRQQYVPDCVALTPKMVKNLGWLPESCAYRRLSENKGLEAWHPLLSGTAQTVVDVGVSVIGKVESESNYKNEDAALDAWMDKPIKPLWVQPIHKTKY